ncbi:hypothetical protein DSO57_1010936 [Entomophthora muscae]|uniref:Uncharacterized protein n=1 Tax=Entomophthora muscae TaxID=34485 RepID=A0ACC2SVJ2_9FUNG|nr:hypothetical protein DSO57_1010936 [Entomophthora muscae]
MLALKALSLSYSQSDVSILRGASPPRLCTASTPASSVRLYLNCQLALSLPSHPTLYPLQKANIWLLPPVYPIRRRSEPTLRSVVVAPMECKLSATFPARPIRRGSEPTIHSNAVPSMECKPLATSPIHPIHRGPKPTIHSNAVPHKGFKPSVTSPTHPIRRKVRRRSISPKAKIERTLAHQDTVTFVSLLNLALRSYIKELSRLSLEELYEEYQISFYMNPPPNCRTSPRPFLLTMGTNNNLADYRAIMMAQMTSHALGLCHISPRDACMFRQPEHSEGFSAKISLDLVVKKLEFLQSRSLADSGKFRL